MYLARQNVGHQMTNGLIVIFLMTAFVTALLYAASFLFE